MKIKKFKRKCINISLILIITGAFLSIVGFGTVGFNYNHLKEQAVEEAWYITIHINEDKLWYGAKLGDNIHLLTIGNAE